MEGQMQQEVEKQSREAGIYLVITKEGGLFECMTKKDAVNQINSMGADRIASIYKGAKKVELQTRVTF